MSYKDLREWLEKVDQIGELKKLEGVDWDVEAVAIAEMTDDAVLFDKFPGYPDGYRMASNLLRSNQRWLLALNWQTEARGKALAREWCNRLKNFKSIPPKWVRQGPILEHIDTGKNINVLKFPVPKMHPRDAGRYIGSGDAVITRNPDNGLINMGTFRLQVHDETTLALNVAHGKDTHLIVRKYHKEGKPCPVVALVGVEPAIFYASGTHIVHLGQAGEYEFAGWLKGESIEVIEGELTGLPIPAYAEIAIEGEVRPNDTRIEGPYGEWTGYSQPRENLVIRVKRVLYRNNPILTVQSPSRPTRPPARGTLAGDPRRGGLVWYQMETAGVRGIQGVACYSQRFFTVVSIKNEYAGQARQAGHVAAQCNAGAFLGRFTIVVDDDVDPFNLDEVIWAVSRRADPERAIDIVRYCWSDEMDSAIPYREVKEAMPPVYSSRCIIDACRPVEWDPNHQQSVVFPPELQAKILERWGKILFPKGRREVIGWGY